MTDAVAHALAAVDFDAYAVDGGTVLPQSSSPAIIAAMLRQLDVHPGMRVFEVGTGCGFSTALLCHLVGATGRVDSVDVDPELIRRAAARLRRGGLTQANLAAGDARVVLPNGNLYNRLIAWATADLLPDGWVAAVPLGRIVAPLRLRPIEGAAPVARVVVGGGTPAVEGFSPGGFVPLTGSPITDFEGLRTGRADIAVDGGFARLGLSAPWIRGAPRHVLCRVQALAGDLTPCPTPLRADEVAEDLWWYLVSRNPEGLMSATLVPGGMAFGCGDAGGLVLLKRRHEAGEMRCVATGAPDHGVERLSSWIADWRSEGSPGLSQLQGTIERTSEAAWRVSAVM